VSDTSSATLAAIFSAASRLVQRDERLQTAIPFLTLIRSGRRTVLNRGLLKPSFCLVIEGRKETHLGRHIVRYGAGDYLVSVIDVPSSGQVVRASRAIPYLAASIELDVREIVAVVLEAKVAAPPARSAAPAAFVGRADGPLLDAVWRLLQLLEAPPQDAAFLAGAIKREIVYRLLTGENGALLFQNAVVDHQELGIGKAIHWLRQHIDLPLRVEELARASNMSVSSLHHKFKAVTAMGPLQFHKQLRLQEARRLLLTGSVDASGAAARVGYESGSQFSREYSRYFGAPPMQDIRHLTADAGRGGGLQDQANIGQEAP